MKNALLTVILAFAAVTALYAEPGALDLSNESAFLMTAGSEWESIAPGVWQRATESGNTQRVGFGIEAFEFELAEARARYERVALEKAIGSDEELADLAKLIAGLKESIAQGQREGAKATSESGSVCSGHYSLDTPHTVGFVSGTATASGTWSEFGPFAPYSHQLQTFASAEVAGYPTATDFDSYLWSGACCVAVQSSATTVPLTFTCDLFSVATLVVWNGCSAYRTASRSSTC